MKKTLLSVALAVATVFTASAQEQEEKTWTFQNVGGLNLSQTSLTNWAAGGDNSVAWHIYFNGSANYKKGKWSWDNALVTDFGQTYTATNKWQKSLDKLNINTKVGYAINKHWNAAFLADFLTQFANGYSSATDKAAGIAPISKFMAPGYLTTSLGFDYKPKENFSLFLSPATGKFTFVTDKALSDAGAYGVKPGNKVLAELGATAVANYHTNLAENINLISKLTLFTAYNNNFGNIDILWDTMLSFKVSKYISANVSATLVYDDDIKSVKNGVVGGPKLQIRQVFGLGLSYSF
ncbi:MAG: DUF3078 domain-containing protein [Phocaeicola sp.]|nr:DUF3078 domain-containing protein [Phocaeicola sp.]